MSEAVTRVPAADQPTDGLGIDPGKQGLNLFLTGFLVLFLELACIRWFAATVIFLQFFTTIILLACFVGMSCGCMAARHRRDWLGHFPMLALGAVLAALALLRIYTLWKGFVIDVGHQASPQQIFFGTEYRNPDIARFVVPIEVIAAVFFVLVALMFVGLGQVMGRAFDAYPNRLVGYTLNISGSLAGIAAFSLLSLVQVPPSVWFLIACAGIAYLLYQHGRLTWLRGLALVGFIVAPLAPIIYGQSHGWQIFWSPYYAVEYRPAESSIFVNNISHQTMVPFARTGGVYSLIHLLQRGSGGEPFHDVLVIGAGTGNDIDHALHYGVDRIDAVEIDPAIQKIGITDNPDRPYSDPRVVRHLDDGRHFLRTTDRKYDLVVYALVDSLILHSGYANIRLESYLFTEQALADIKRVLKPDGLFVAYNYFRQGWVVERLAAMSESVFGCKPIVLTLPYQKTLPASSQAGLVAVVAGCNQQIAHAFATDQNFWLNVVPARNRDVNGFAVRPENLPVDEQQSWHRIAPTTLVHDLRSVRFATDDWPFLYVKDKLIPILNIREMALLAILGFAMVYYFLPKGTGRLQFYGRMFFLGAAFMLLETKAVVQLALLFGSTWIVNSLVFATALILILLANFFVLKTQPTRLAWHYVGLLILLAVAILTPLNVFLSGGLLWRYVVPAALALGPMFFAGVIFASSFRDAPDPDVAFGWNIAGSVVGGLSESFSMLLGFRYLLLLAVAFYLLSAWMPAPRTRMPVNAGRV
jgi:SAM-dependent methyltransferase